MGEENISENDAEVTQYQVQSLSFFQFLGHRTGTQLGRKRPRRVNKGAMHPAEGPSSRCR
jgi:hypothetical protein